MSVREVNFTDLFLNIFWREVCGPVAKRKYLNYVGSADFFPYSPLVAPGFLQAR